MATLSWLFLMSLAIVPSHHRPWAKRQGCSFCHFYLIGLSSWSQNKSKLTINILYQTLDVPSHYTAILKREIYVISKNCVKELAWLWPAYLTSSHISGIAKQCEWWHAVIVKNVFYSTPEKTTNNPKSKSSFTATKARFSYRSTF